MNRAQALRSYEIIELTGYIRGATCLECDRELKSIQASANVTPRWTCENDQCSRYGLEALMAVYLKAHHEDPDERSGRTD